MKTFKALSCLAALSVVSYAQGAVVLEDSYEAGASSGAASDLGGGTFGYEFTLDPGTEFSAAGHDKLVLMWASWDAANANAAVSSITYDGVALTEAVFSQDNGARVTAGIYYLDNVATDGTLRVELAPGANANIAHASYGLFAVDGLKDGVQDTASGRVDPPNEAEVTITTNDGFFVQQATRNNQSLAGDGGDDYETLLNYNVDSFRSLAQYQVTDAAGDYYAPINNGGVNFRTISSAAFEAVPEPSSLALLGLGGLLIARRRRA